jgi:hypothetical protein
MPKVKVDGIEVEVPQGATVRLPCEQARKGMQRSQGSRGRALEAAE